MTRAAAPFSPRAVMAMLAVGAGAFLLLLYAIGAGWDGRDDRDGGAHAAANGLNGFAGVVRLLEAHGHSVSLSRSEARLDEAALLVLTPPMFADGEALSRIVERRRYRGPTVLILPKWMAMPVSGTSGIEAPRGWVVIAGTLVPRWLEDFDLLDESDASIAARQRWRGMGRAGRLPDPERVQALSGTDLVPLVRADDGRALAGYVADGGAYPALAEAAAARPNRPGADAPESDLWPVVIVAEPDLMNNYGMADPGRAELARAIVAAALEGSDLPIVFDLTLPGLGRSENLLTLAFEPPFLAATLCLILAALVIAWRALRRFGPPAAESPALAMGKRQLARNAAGLIERTRRLHLLGPPYAALVAARLAAALGIRGGDPAEREAAIARILAARGIAADYLDRAEALRGARRPAELLRAARALATVERMLDR